MKKLEELSLTELVNGYYFDSNYNAYFCSECGTRFEQGEIFAVGKRFFSAERAVKEHISAQHPDRLEQILLFRDSPLSLTNRQQELLILFSKGLKNQEIAEKLGIAVSTVRHQRFVFRERARSAKFFLAVWEIACKNSENPRENHEFLPPHRGAKMVDERYVITQEENEKILQDAFFSLEPLRLRSFPKKEKKKIAVLRKITEQFERGKQYTEHEINEILSNIHMDYATLRRYLIEYGYFERTRDCKLYWVK